MDIFWCQHTNRIITASPCVHCGGYRWYGLGEDTIGQWSFDGCYPERPPEGLFLKVKGEHIVQGKLEETLPPKRDPAPPGAGPREDGGIP